MMLPEYGIVVLDCTSAGTSNGTRWCKSEYYQGLCWSSTPPGDSSFQNCPGNGTEVISRHCGADGVWLETNKTANFISHCFNGDYLAMANLSISAVTRDTPCRDNVSFIHGIGLSLSVIFLSVIIVCFCCFRKLQIFRNLLWYQVITAALLYAITRLILLIDATALDRHYIHEGLVICPIFHFLMEYCKCVLIFWIFIGTCFLHHAAVWPIFPSSNSVIAWLFLGYIIPLAQTILWFATYFGAVRSMPDTCLGCYTNYRIYYLHSIPMIIEITLSLLLVLNTSRALWCNRYRDKPTVWMFRDTNFQCLMVIIWSFGIVLDPFVNTRSRNITSFMSAYEGIILGAVFFCANKMIMCKRKDVSVPNKKIDLVDSNEETTGALIV